MRRALFISVTAAMMLTGVAVGGARPAKDTDVELSGPSFTVAGLMFTVPSKWLSVSPLSEARMGQWQVPPLHEGEPGGEVVVFYFGKNAGGNAKENIEAWHTLFDAEGPAAAEVKHHDAGGLKISQLVIFGTYNEPMRLPGIPPASKANYGLAGVVMEGGAQGSIYWRFTGPEALITANLPLFNKIIDSVKPQDK